VASTAFIQEVDEDLLKPARISGHIGQGLGMLVVMAMPALAHHVLQATAAAGRSAADGHALNLQLSEPHRIEQGATMFDTRVDLVG
jgi:hypothetical protein